MQEHIKSSAEYKIGNTTYIVNVKFSDCKETVNRFIKK